MEIKPKIGIDNLKFGMTRKEVIGILGEPDRIIVDPNDKNDVILEWTDKLLRLVFYLHHNDRFAYLRTKNPNLTYDGKGIINRNVEIVIKEVFGNLVTDWEVEDFTSFITHFDENLWINLDVEYGIVNGFELGVTYKNDEEYDWPN
jgi:hypothetical protein